MAAKPAPMLQRPAAWAKAKETPAWLLAAVTAHEKWDREAELELTEYAFDAAIAVVSGITVGGEPKPVVESTEGKD